MNDIYLAELKVGDGAIYGPSGIVDHVRKAGKLIKKEEACLALREDVDSIIKQKKELSLIEGEPKVFHYAPRPKLMFILGYRNEEEKERIDKEIASARSVARELCIAEPVVKWHTMMLRLD